jgi:hypothetical protein
MYALSSVRLKGRKPPHCRRSGSRINLAPHCRPDSGHRERVLLTQSVNCEFTGLDRLGLVSPSYRGLETIRNQTLPEVSSPDRLVQCDCWFMIGLWFIAMMASVRLAKGNVHCEPLPNR